MKISHKIANEILILTEKSYLYSS